MRRAIEFAKKAANPSPNPRVGAVILNRGKIVGSGFHENCGGPHAEILAIQNAGKLARGGELFVTLEPCNHVGKTPPCSRAILSAGIRKVFVGMRDPTAAGGGAKFLAAKGVDVSTGILEKECRELNKIWLRNVEQKMPFVALKLALDERGSPIPPPGRKWITGAKSRREVAKMRRQFDAVAVGVGTIVADDPRLNVRGIRCDRQPVRIIFDPNLRSPAAARIFHDGGETILISRTEFPKYDLRKILRKLFERGIRSIFLEGGPTTARKFLDSRLVDEVFIFQKGATAKNKIWRKIRLEKIDEFDGDGLFWRKLNKC